MSQLTLSASSEYLCYVSTATINIYCYSAGVDIRRQNLTSKVDLRASRVEGSTYTWIGVRATGRASQPVNSNHPAITINASQPESR